MSRPRRFSLIAPAVLVAAGAARAQYGAVLTGAGPVNRSVAGVATGMPLSPAGALFWNPATLAGLEGTQLEASAELLFPNTNVTSSVSANSFAPGFPPVDLSGRQSSDSSVFPLPTIGLSYAMEGSDFRFGLGVFALAGFGVDYAGSTTVPLLTAPPPNGVGFGPVYSDFQVLQIVPAVAYRVTDRLTVSAAPVLNLATLRVDPGIFGAPDDANGDRFGTYPRGSHGRTVWGGGFVFGAYYRADAWGAGASVRSPQWLDTFRFNSNDELGRPRQLTFDLDMPMIVSAGASYTGLAGWVFGADVRYIDYASTRGFGTNGATPDGAVRGLGWESVFAVALGAQYQVSDALSVRAGYSWGGNPIPDGVSFVNTVAPTIVEHTLSAGLTWNVTRQLALSAAYLHGFENAIGGPVLTPAGPVAGTSVRNAASFDSLVIGATVTFGGCAPGAPAPGY